MGTLTAEEVLYIWSYGISAGSSCPSGTTVSSSSIQVCFCDAPQDQSETPYATGIALDVNGSTVTHTLSNPVQSENCITYDVTGDPFGSGDVIVFKYDGSWGSPVGALDVSIRNTIAAVFLVATITLDFLVDTSTGSYLIGA